MKKIFLAFPGYQLKVKQKIKKIGDVEVWNLDKIHEDEFISLIQKKVKPANRNIKNRYKEPKELDSYKNSYKECSWGLLLPCNKGLFDFDECHFLVNLFTDAAQPLGFHVDHLGIRIHKEKFSFMEKASLHSYDKKFATKNFAKFYKNFLGEMKDAFWNAYIAKNWGLEEWRFYVACLSFRELQKYQNGKGVMRWQAECADIVSLYETILTTGKNDGGMYNMSQRIEVLLGARKLKIFPGSRIDLKKLFMYRNEFVHGSFYKRLKKETKLHPGSPQMAQLPTMDYNFLVRQYETARKVFISILYLRKKIRKSKLNKFTTSEVIEMGVIDTNLRKRIQKYAGEAMKITA